MVFIFISATCLGPNSIFVCLCLLRDQSIIILRLNLYHVYTTQNEYNTTLDLSHIKLIMEDNHDHSLANNYGG